MGTMRILDGLELRGYIQERQAKQVRALRQSWRVIPKLAIVQTIDDAVIDSSEAHNNQMLQLLSDPARAANFARVVFELLVR